MSIRSWSEYIGILIILLLFSCARKINPGKPVLAATAFQLDSLPLSEISLPITVSLRPFYEMAEHSVDTLFTSPDYPNGWVQETCDTRYKYSFRRGPLQLKASATTLTLGFTGYYRIVGSTRACVAGAAITSWTAPCRCGFDEAERKVNISFVNKIAIAPDYKMSLAIKRNEPQALDKCEVCFWGQDITSQVLSGLKKELDLSRQTMEKSYGSVDLRPKFQQLWNQLGKVYNVYDVGWLQINPQRFRLNNMFAKGDSLYIYLGLSARPLLTLDKPGEKMQPIPVMSDISRRQGFNIFLDAQLNYDSLSRIMNRQLKGKSFDFKKGPVKKTFIINDCALMGANNERLIIKVEFGGTDKGIVYMTGKPVFVKETNRFEVRDIEFDIRSKDALLKTADWLFSKRITNEIAAYTKFDLASYIDAAKTQVNQQLNRSWVKGVSGYGEIKELKLLAIYPLKDHLLVRSNCSGNLSVKVEALDMSY